MFENVSLSFQGIWGHKLRSFLTMLGIIIGIASIITIVSTIKGTNEQIKTNIIGSGNNVVTVEISSDKDYYDPDYSEALTTVSPLEASDRAEILKLDGVDKVSIYTKRNYADSIYYRSNSFNGNVYGIDSYYFDLYDYKLDCGRLFIDDDYYENMKVIIIDDYASSALFESDNPLGKIVEIKGESFEVVGVVSAPENDNLTINNIQDYYMYSTSTNGNIFIPSSSWGNVYRYDEPQSVAVKATNTDTMTTAGNNVSEYLNSHRVNGGSFEYKAEDLLQQASDIQALAESSNNQLIWIAGISLLVGGIGVMNIMLVSVTERTREIGLKMAIGARKRRILWQFLTEAGVLTCLGGILGVLCGIGLAFMLSSVMGTPTAISAGACIIAVIFSMVIGIIFGIIPAIKASKLSPIDALRRE